MDNKFLLAYLSISFLIGALAFNLIVIFLFRSGLVFASRDREGHLKQRIPLKGILLMLGFLSIIIGFMAAANYLGLVARQVSLAFWPLFLLNLGLILSLILYDSLVIDWLVIGLWRPEFLHLPEEMDKAQMKLHLSRTLVAGPIFGTLLALASTLITYFTWMHP